MGRIHSTAHDHNLVFSYGSQYFCRFYQRIVEHIEYITNKSKSIISSPKLLSHVGLIYAIAHVQKPNNQTAKLLWEALP